MFYRKAQGNLGNLSGEPSHAVCYPTHGDKARFSLVSTAEKDKYNRSLIREGFIVETPC